MLKNRFRQAIALIILLVFGRVIYLYIQKTSGSPYIGDALADGLKFLLFLALVLYVVSLIDRRMKKRRE